MNAPPSLNTKLYTVIPAATPYGVNADGTPFELMEGWQQAEFVSKPSSPVELPSLTTKDLRQRKRGFPYHQHPRLPICGHKFVAGDLPRFRNCESCWFAFFQTHGELTQAAEEVYQQFGLPGLSDLRGIKFAQNFLKFMATVAQWKQQAEVVPDVSDTPEGSAAVV